eukprot:3691301-Pyramimonas_sp.AAC.1
MELKKDLVTDGWGSRKILLGMDGAIRRSDWGWIELRWARCQSTGIHGTNTNQHESIQMGETVEINKGQ